jgi:hypothetical protein
MIHGGLERRVWQFYTICDKNQLLNVKTEKVMAILVPRWLDLSCQVRLQMCLKICMAKIAVYNYREPERKIRAG